MIYHPQQHNFDRHADKIARSPDLTERDPKQMLKPEFIASMLSVSTQWLDGGREAGYGPPWTRLSKRVVRYPCGAFIEYLLARGVIYADKEAAKIAKRAPKQPAPKRTKPALQAAE